MLIFLFVTINLFYLGSIAFLAYYWWKIDDKKNIIAEGGRMLSVVIVVRNEEKNIKALLQDLAAQQYDLSCLEVLVVNDHSEDATCQQVLAIEPNLPYKLRLLHLGVQTGKKAGMELGVAEAKASIVLVTDGDCRLSWGWLRHMANLFITKGAVFVAGPVCFHQEESLFEKLQTIEFASLVGAGAAMLKAGKAGMCNAANMAFHKEVFQQLQGTRSDRHIPSGDDEFLLQAMVQYYPEKVFFLKEAEAVVFTKGQRRWQEFYQQRKRWAGKWRLHRKPSILITAAAVFMLQAAWLGISVLAAGHLPLFYFFGGLLLKFGAEFLFLRSVLRNFGKSLALFPFLILQLLYPFYVLFFGLAVNFGKFTWKGRTYNYSKL